MTKLTRKCDSIYFTYNCVNVNFSLMGRDTKDIAYS